MEKAFIARIKAKRELQGVPDEYVASLLTKRFPQGAQSKKDEKLILKAIRSDLRKTTGRYHTKKGATHLSTDERKEFYSFLNTKITALHPQSILDLGCGQNPLYQAKKGMQYYAYDLNEHDLEKVKEFFQKEGIVGTIKVTDITTEETFPRVDLTLAYKVLDIIDTKGHAKATVVLRKLDTKFLVASFPTISLSGRKMHTARRLWFEKALETNGYLFETFHSNNEIFYLARRRSDERTSAC